MMRVGHGYDVHALVAGRELILGGVKIPHFKGLQGHSDADALIHAICDACLGAAALGDIGRYFPDTDARYRNIESRVLLRHVKQILDEHGWSVANIDSTLLAQAPRLSPYFDRMRTNIALDLGIEEGRVNIKATTAEKLGFIGREEGIAAHAVALIARKPK